jgi:hypothetical protein
MYGVSRWRARAERRERHGDLCADLTSEMGNDFLEPRRW